MRLAQFIQPLDGDTLAFLSFFLANFPKIVTRLVLSNENLLLDLT